MASKLLKSLSERIANDKELSDMVDDLFEHGRYVLVNHFFLSKKIGCGSNSC